MEYEEIEIRKRIEEAKHNKFCAEQKMHQADIQIGEYDLQLLNLNKEKEVEIAKEKPELYREYPESCISRAPIIVDVHSDGTLQMEKQKTNLYTMHKLIELKKKIPQKKRYPTFTSLANSVSMNVNTTQRLCAGIEYGMYDHIFKKWEQMPLKFKEGQLV